jgi:hypothetical protein
MGGRPALSAVARRAVVLAVLPALACAFGRAPVAEVDPRTEAETRFERALASLDERAFERATEDLEWLVARCASGGHGRTALLLLASAELDAGNPAGSPLRARRFASAYLMLPWPAEAELPLARTLYLLAVDLAGPAERVALLTGEAADGQALPGGAADSLRVGSSEVGGEAIEGAGSDGDGNGRSSPPAAVGDTAAEKSEDEGGYDPDATPVASRFDYCEGGGVPRWSAGLPVHPGATTAERLAALEAEASEGERSLEGARRLMAEQSARIRELEAEIERIRKLLRGGGGRGRPPGR